MYSYPLFCHQAVCVFTRGVPASYIKVCCSPPCKNEYWQIVPPVFWWRRTNVFFWPQLIKWTSFWLLWLHIVTWSELPQYQYAIWKSPSWQNQNWVLNSANKWDDITPFGVPWLWMFLPAAPCRGQLLRCSQTKAGQEAPPQCRCVFPRMEHWVGVIKGYSFVPKTTSAIKQSNTHTNHINEAFCIRLQYEAVWSTGCFTLICLTHTNTCHIGQHTCTSAWKIMN